MPRSLSSKLCLSLKKSRFQKSFHPTAQMWDVLEAQRIANAKYQQKESFEKLTSVHEGKKHSNVTYVTKDLLKSNLSKYCTSIFLPSSSYPVEHEICSCFIYKNQKLSFTHFILQF